MLEQGNMSLTKATVGPHRRDWPRWSLVVAVGVTVPGCVHAGPPALVGVSWWSHCFSLLVSHLLPLSAGCCCGWTAWCGGDGGGVEWSEQVHDGGSERAVEVRAASLLEPPGAAFFAVVPGCGTERVVSAVRGVVCGWPSAKLDDAEDGRERGIQPRGILYPSCRQGVASTSTGSQFFQGDLRLAAVRPRCSPQSKAVHKNFLNQHK